MKLISFNINGLRTKIYSLENVFGNVDIIFIQESKLSTKLSFPLFKKFKEYHAISSKPGHKGVTVLINKKTDIEVLDVNQEIFENENGRILVMNIKKNNKIYCLINVYVFHVNNTANEELLKQKVKYVNWFINLIKKYIRENENLIVAGDFNLGRSITAYDIYPSHKYPRKQPGFCEVEEQLFKKWMSNVKDDLIDVQKKYSPNKIRYTFFSQRTTVPNIMWIHNNGLIVDYIFISKHLYKFVKKFDINYKDYELNLSDHLPLRLDIDI